MKKKKELLTVTFALTLLLTSCGGQVDSEFLLPIEETQQDAEIITNRSAENFEYAYSLLAENEQKLYLELLDILQNRKEQIAVSCTDTEKINKVFQCVMNDHPELFYVKGYRYEMPEESEEVLELTVSGIYSMKEGAIASYQKCVEDYVEECMAGLPENADEYTKVKYVYEYLIQNTEYKLSAIENQNICSVFLYKESVCTGYAKAMQYLLNRMDVFCTLVEGTVDAGEKHAWNLVRIDGEFYYVDVTWGDAFYKITDHKEEIPNNVSSIHYDYLCVNTEQLLKTHTITNVVPMPNCTSVQANYYVKENAYFIEADEKKIARIFEDAYERGESYVTFKCDSLEIYEEILAQMLDEQRVFDYLRSGTDSVVYSSDEKQLTISFWL